LPSGSAVVVIATGTVDCAAIVTVNDASAWLDGFEASLARTVKVAVPAVVGVPDSDPELALNDRPDGSVPDVTLHVNAPDPPVADSVAANGDPTCPDGSAVVVIATGTGGGGGGGTTALCSSTRNTS